MTKTSLTFLEKVIIYLVLLLANLRALVFVFLFPDTSRPFGAAWFEILLWVLCTASMVHLIYRDGNVSNYLGTWRRNSLLVLFLGLAMLSIFWSVAPVASVFRIFELIFATVLAAYFGMKLMPEKMMEILFWFGAILIILSIALVYGAPPTGTMYWAPFHGAWRGVYWHRNHLASVTAFLSVVYLCRLILAVQKRNTKGILDGVFYVLSLAILYFSKSATGYIVFLVLNFSVLVILLWLRLNPHLKKKHYLLLLGLGTVFILLALMNLNLIFGLFNRDATMTGRVGLWSHLLDIASERPWLGHGFGAVWTIDAFREQIRQLVGWTSQPLIGDNGFIDIFLHLGGVGVILFISVLALGIIRSLRYAIAEKTLAGFFPVLVFIYALFANITFSLFIETEVFVWFLIVSVLFMTTPERVPVMIKSGKL